MAPCRLFLSRDFLADLSTFGFDVVFSEPDPNDITGKKILNSYHRKLTSAFKGNGPMLHKLNRIKANLSSKTSNDANFGAELSRYDNVVSGYFFFPSLNRLTHMTQEEVDEGGSRIQNSAIGIIRGSKFAKNAPIYEMQAAESNTAALSTRNEAYTN